MITFGLPDQQSRQTIIAQYAKQLTKPELEEVTRVTEGHSRMYGRDIRDFFQQAERSWASKVIREEESKNEEQGRFFLLCKNILRMPFLGRRLYVVCISKEDLKLDLFGRKLICSPIGSRIPIYNFIVYGPVGRID